MEENLFKHKISVTGFDIFKEVLSLVKNICEDDRMDKELRDEYYERMEQIADKERDNNEA